MADVPLHSIRTPLMLVVGGGVCTLLPDQVVVHLTRGEGKHLASTKHLFQNVVPTHAQDNGGGTRREQTGLGRREWV